MERRYGIYKRQDRGLPRIVSFLEYEESEKSERPYAIIAKLPYVARHDGLPQQGELAKVHDLEEHIENSLQQDGALLLGHVTYNGAMLVLLYSPVPSSSKLVAKVNIFKKVEIELESRLDPNWDIFALEIEPTDLEAEQARNQQLLGILSQKGDDHSKPREVDFAARFPTADSRRQFISTVLANGFYTREEGSTWEYPDDFWCEVVLMTPIEDVVIAEQSLYVRKTADTFGGQFDGWACHVTS